MFKYLLYLANRKALIVARDLGLIQSALRFFNRCSQKMHRMHYLAHCEEPFNKMTFCQYKERQAWIAAARKARNQTA